MIIDVRTTANEKLWELMETKLILKLQQQVM